MSVGRGLVAAVPALAALVFWRPGYDVFLTVKATTVVLGALALLAVGLVALTVSGRLAVPSRPVGIPLGLYVAALLLATAAAEQPLLAVAGRAGRHVGLAVALACVVCFVAAATAFRDRSPTPVIAAVVGAAVPVIGYALVQAAGSDPLGWRLVEGGPAVFSTLGNANFLSAWLGIVVPLAAGGALARGWRLPWRAASAAVATLALVAAGTTASLQGVVGGLAGLALTLAGWAAARGHSARALAGGLGAMAAATVVAIAAAPGDVAGRAAQSLANRLGHWETAWGMAGDHPLRGVGLAGFPGWFRTYEDPAAAADRGLDRVLDSAHSVPLDLLASGGWPLLGAWLALLGAVAWALARAWRRAAPDRRVLLSALAGGWGAYLLQALVSIDVPPVAVLGWTLAGLAVAQAGEVSARSVPPRAARPLAVGLLVALSPLVVAAVAPIRADHVAARGLEAEDGDAPAAAGHALARAAELAPWEPRYPALRGAVLNRQGDEEGALAAYEEAHRRDPRALSPLLNVARLSLAVDDTARAQEAYAEAVRLAPHTPEVRAEADEHLPLGGR